MFQIQFLKKWADKKAKGEDGRSDVPPKTYFQEDEDLLNMIQNVTIHQKKCVGAMLSCSAELKFRITFIANTSWN